MKQTATSPSNEKKASPKGTSDQARNSIGPGQTKRNQRGRVEPLSGWSNLFRSNKTIPKKKTDDGTTTTALSRTEFQKGTEEQVKIRRKSFTSGTDRVTTKKQPQGG